MADNIKYENGTIIYSPGSIPERDRALMFDNLIYSLNNKGLLITLVNPAVEVSDVLERSLDEDVFYLSGRINEDATDGDIIHILGQIIRETDSADEASGLMQFIYKELVLSAEKAIMSIAFSEMVASMTKEK